MAQMRPKLLRVRLPRGIFLNFHRVTTNGGTDLGFAPAVKLSGEWSVKRVLEEIPSEAPAEGSSSPIPFFHMLSRLKTTKREGWRRFGIERSVCGWTCRTMAAQTKS